MSHRGHFPLLPFRRRKALSPPNRAGPRCPRPLRVGASGVTLLPLLPQRHPSTLTTPEHTVELRGATLSWAGKDKSSKKHVLEVSPVTARGGDIGHPSVSTRGPQGGGNASTCPVHPTSGEGDVLGLVVVGTIGDIPGLGAKGRAVLSLSLSYGHGDVTEGHPRSWRGFSSWALHGEEVSSRPGSPGNGNNWGHRCDELGAVLSHKQVPKAAWSQPTAGSAVALP